MSDQAIDKEKSTLTVDESDILAMSEKIRQNQEEDRAFAEQLDSFLKRTEKSSDFLHIGKTPNALAILGADQKLDVVISPRTITKCMAEPEEHYHGHALSQSIMEQIPQELRNPVMIFKGSQENSLVAITELKDSQNRGVMIAVSLCEKNGFSEVNRISSVYGKDRIENYFRKQIGQGNLVAINKEKTDRMLHSAGLQLPLENTFISFDNSIAYSTANVKRVSEKTQELTGGFKMALLTYIDQNTRNLAFMDTEIQKLAEATQKKADALMTRLQEQGLSTTSINRNGEAYTDKAVVSVEYATKYNPKTKQKEPLMDKDGNPVKSVQAAIRHTDGKDFTALIFHAKEDISDGVKFSAMSAMKFEKNQNGKMSPTYIKGVDIAGSEKIPQELKNIAAFAKENILEQEAERSTSFAYITKETKALAAENPVVDRLSKAALAQTNEMMQSLRSNDLKTTAVNKDGKVYAPMAAVQVQPAMQSKTINGKKSLIPMTHWDGSPVHSIQATIRQDQAMLILSAKDDISKGVQFHGMAVKTYVQNENGKMSPTYIKGADIANSPLVPQNLKDIATAVKETQTKEKQQETPQKSTTKQRSPFSRARLNETAQEIRKSEQKNSTEKSQQRKKDDMSL